MFSLPGKMNIQIPCFHCSMADLHNNLAILPPATKLWEGNVLTPVCLFTGGCMMSLPVWLPGPMFFPEVSLQRGGMALHPPRY